MTQYKETQRKPCTVLMASLRRGEERRAEFENVVRDAVSRYDGYLSRSVGSIFQAVFGTPAAHEDDPERAVRTALLILKRTAELPPGDPSPECAIGIHLGLVFTGELPAAAGLEQVVMGEAVAIASRLMEAAPNMTALVSNEVIQIVRPVFDFGPVASLSRREGEPELAGHPVVKLKTGFIRRRGIEGLQSPIVGRDAELGILTGAVDQLFSGRGDILILTGEAGVGKSRLVEETFAYSLGISLEQGKTMNWCTGLCSPYKETLYLPFIDIIKQIADIHSDDQERTACEKLLRAVEDLGADQADETFPYIAHLLAFSLAPQHEAKLKYLDPKELKTQTHIAIVSLMMNYARRNPVVYCIDDLYLADAPTLECIRFMIETNPTMSCVLILISRPEKEKPWWRIREAILARPDAVELTIPRLTTENVRTISRHLLKIPKLSEKIIGSIVEQAEGNPFYLEELIKLFIAKGILVRRGKEWHATSVPAGIAIPYTVEGIIRARYDTMTPALRGVLAEMSVIGRTFSKKVLAACTAHGELLDQALAESAELGFITSSDGEAHSFTHAVIRDVIYSSLSAGKLRDLHLKAAQALESIYADRRSEISGLLFEHYRMTGRNDKTVEFGIQAGDTARRRYANQEAIDLYQSLLKFLVGSAHTDRRRTVLMNLGRLYESTGEAPAARRHLEEARQISPNPMSEAEVDVLIADVFQSVSDYAAALGIYQRAEQTLNSIPEASRTDRIKEQIFDVRLGIAWVHYLTGKYEETSSILTGILSSLAETDRSPVREIKARCHNIMGSVYTHLGRRQESFDSYQSALRLYESLDDMVGQGVIYNNIIGHFTDQGDFYRALEYLNRSHEIDLKTGNLLSRAISTYNMGETYHQLGDLSAAESRYREYLALNARINNRLGNGYGNWGLGSIFLDRGDLEAAQRHLDLARSIFEELGSRSLMTNVQLTQAALLRRKHEFKAALDLCSEVAQAARQNQERGMLFSALLTRAEIIADLASQEKKMMIMYLQQARDIAHDAAAISREIDLDRESLMRLHVVQARITREIGETKIAAEHLRQAREIRDQIIDQMPDAAARALYLALPLNREMGSG